LTEEKTEQIEEKEEKRKIMVISKIDDKFAIQGQSVMKGQLKEALDLADQIIDLAKTENLTSFIREQEQLIARIKGLMKQREEKKKEKVRAELGSELKKLEKEYNDAFKVEDFVKVKQVIGEAKKLLFQSDAKRFIIKWDNIERKYLDTIARKEIQEDITNLIKESSELKKRFQFEDLKLRLTYLLQQVQEKGLNEYKGKLEDLRRDVIAAQDSYNKINKDIKELKEKILAQKENKEFEKAIPNCESLIQLAKSIEKAKEAEDYSQVLIQLKEDLKFEELKVSILKLNNEGLGLLKKGEISDSVKMYEKIRNSLREWV
jgi:hypothetical protein